MGVRHDEECTSTVLHSHTQAGSVVACLQSVLACAHGALGHLPQPTSERGHLGFLWLPILDQKLPMCGLKQKKVYFVERGRGGEGCSVLERNQLVTTPEEAQMSALRSGLWEVPRSPHTHEPGHFEGKPTCPPSACDYVGHCLCILHPVSPPWSRTGHQRRLGLTFLLR